MILDSLLFKEKTHLKRGSGFTTIPEKLLHHTKSENMNIKEEIRDLFIEKFTSSLVKEKTSQSKEI
jgi:hypothetical protein